MTNPITASATRLRLVLFIALGLAIVAIVSLVIFGVRFLDSYAAEVNETVYAASTSNDRLLEIRQQVEELENNSAAVTRAQQIVAESQSYRYQDVIIRDLESFANQAGVQITNFNFTTSDSGSGTGAAPQADQAAGDPAAGAASPDGTAATPMQPAAPVSQLKSTTVNITLANPVDYRKFLQFVNYIEQNLTKMQISTITMSGGSGNTITSDALTIEVYIR